MFLEENKRYDGQNLENMIKRLIGDLAKVGKEAELRVVIERIDDAPWNRTQINYHTAIKDGNVYLFVYDYKK